MLSRRFVYVVATLVLFGCQTDQGLAPTGETPAFAISDGARGGNPEFFFLPPMVPNPVGSPNYTPATANPNLSPIVVICALDAITEDEVTTTTSCLAPGAVSGFPVSFTRDGSPTGVQLVEDRYQVDWQTPSIRQVFRVTVLVGTKTLGFADVHVVPSNRGNGRNFAVVKSGSTLPIKFRIEARALCANPAGTGPCASASVDLGAGGTVALVTDPLIAPSGVGIPAQGTQQTVTVTVETCADFNPRAIDLPTFGSCLTITSDPVLAQQLSPAATVFVCDYPPDVSGLPHAQQELVTLHRLSNGLVQALPHATAACSPPSPGPIAQLRGVLRHLGSGEWKAAGSRMLGLIGPTPLVALDRGGGGLTFEFSDFQFALPAKMSIAAGNGQTGAPGATLPINPTVLVTDLEGAPVAGATVHFAGTGAVGAASAVTGANGLAGVSWTLGASANALTASGRGIAGANVDGPRSIFDPFMPIDGHFNPANDPVPNPPVPTDLQTGTQTFTATTVVVPYGSAGYRYLVVSEGPSPAGWELPGFNDGQFAPGAAPFGSPNASCPLNEAGIATPWPIETRILVRRTFTLTAAGNLEVAIAIDNDVRVFLDGVDISNGAPGNDRFLVHEGCPTRDTFVLSVPGVSAGQHTIAIMGKDRGVSSYLDAEVRLAP